MDHARGRIAGSACWGRSEGTVNSYKVRADSIVDSQLDSLSMHIHMEEGGGGGGWETGDKGETACSPAHTHTTHQCCLSSNPIISKLCGENKFIISIGGLNLLLFLVLASGGFSLRTPVLPSPQSRHFLTQNRSGHARTFLIAFFGAPRCFCGQANFANSVYILNLKEYFLGLFPFKELLTVFSPIAKRKLLLKIDIYRLTEAEYIHRLSLFVRKFNSAMDWISTRN